MRSSSALFPVSLVAAEVLDHLHDDAYLLNPGVSQDPSVRVAVSRLTDPAWDVGRQGPRVPVVLLHSEFHNRHQWLGSDSQGLARQLARAGYDVWMPEMRGHGRSPRNTHWRSNQVSDYVQQDWPAVLAFVAEQSGEAFWLGQGLSALSLAQMLVSAPGEAARVRGAVFIEPGEPRRHWLQKQLSRRTRWRLSRRHSVSGTWGPEEEPAALLRTLFTLHRRARRGDSHPVYGQLRRVSTPSLVISNGNDDPAREFSGLLGAQSRRTLLRHSANSQGPLPPACQPPDGKTALTLLEWLQEQQAGHSHYREAL
ncbi:MAG: alpha/beta fold hydrolase [Oleiphilaceae bacterium]|nr:alpha/beta fold hydrolase [Oleiphilaceae bacterium]